MAGGAEGDVLPGAVIVRLLPGEDPDAVKARLADWPEVTVWTEAEQRSLLLRGVVDRARQQIGLFRVLLSIVSAIIVALILYNMTVAKTHEIALLKLMGGRSRVVVGMILQQSLMLGGIGYAMALTVGYFAFPHFPRRVVITSSELAGLLVLVVVVSVVASLAGIVRALRIPPTIVLAG